MTPHPKFVCAREGHDPLVTVRNTANIVASYVTQCKRCGKWLEIHLTPDQEETTTA